MWWTCVKQSYTRCFSAKKASLFICLPAFQLSLSIKHCFTGSLTCMGTGKAQLCLPENSSFISNLCKLEP